MYVSDVPIKRVKETIALWLHIDKFWSWNKHNEEISQKISSGTGAVRKLNLMHVDHNTSKCAYNAPVLPHFDYCCEVGDVNLIWHFSISCKKYKIWPLKSHKCIISDFSKPFPVYRCSKICKTILPTHSFIPGATTVELALTERQSKTLNERRTQFLASQMYKIRHDLALKRLSDILHESLSSALQFKRLSR